MKIVSCNIFYARAFRELMAFIELIGRDTDVFCFQEMSSYDGAVPQSSEDGKRPNALQEISARLPNHRVFFAPHQENIFPGPDGAPGVTEGLAMFVRRGLEVIDSGEFYTNGGLNSWDGKDYGTLAHGAIWATLATAWGPLTVTGVHGNSEPGDKLDSAARLDQTRQLLEFMASKPTAHVMLGDFNLLPDTESVRAFSAAGYRDLIKEYGITTTRGALMRKMHPTFGTGKYGWQEFADYAFTSPALPVRSFEVPDLPVSDHLPLILNLDVFAAGSSGAR